MALNPRFPDQRGTIALYAILSLAALLALAAWILTLATGRIRDLRHKAGTALAERSAHTALSRHLFEEHLHLPRPWIPAQAGTWNLEDGTRIRWRRLPVEGRWRIGLRPWDEATQERLRRLGADPGKVQAWSAWLQARAAGPHPLAAPGSGLATDPGYLVALFRDLGLERRWGSPRRLWSTDPAAAPGRLNLLGADPEVLEALSGVPAARIRDVQQRLVAGAKDPTHLAGLFSFPEAQALEPHAAPRPFAEAHWELEIRLPQLPDPVLQRWRSSPDEGAPGSPWFQLRRLPMEAW